MILANATVTVSGNLTGNPELRKTASGVSVCNFTIASTPRVYDSATSKWKDGSTLFLRCTLWREYAEHFAAGVTKGQAVLATGTLESSTYTDSDGVERLNFVLQVDEVGATFRWAPKAGSGRRADQDEKPF